MMRRNNRSGWVYIALAVGVALSLLLAGFAHYITDGDVPFVLVLLLLAGSGVLGAGIYLIIMGNSKKKQTAQAPPPQPYDPSQPVIRSTAEAIPDHLQPNSPLPTTGDPQPAGARDSRYDALLPEGYDPSRELGEQTAFFRNAGKFEEAPTEEDKSKKKKEGLGLEDESSASPISFDNL